MYNIYTHTKEFKLSEWLQEPSGIASIIGAVVVIIVILLFGYYWFVVRKQREGAGESKPQSMDSQYSHPKMTQIDSFSPNMGPITNAQMMNNINTITATTTLSARSPMTNNPQLAMVQIQQMQKQAIPYMYNSNGFNVNFSLAPQPIALEPAPIVKSTPGELARPANTVVTGGAGSYMYYDRGNGADDDVDDDEDDEGDSNVIHYTKQGSNDTMLIHSTKRMSTREVDISENDEKSRSNAIDEEADDDDVDVEVDVDAENDVSIVYSDKNVGRDGNDNDDESDLKMNTMVVRQNELQVDDNSAADSIQNISNSSGVNVDLKEKVVNEQDDGRETEIVYDNHETQI